MEQRPTRRTRRGTTTAASRLGIGLLLALAPVTLDRAAAPAALAQEAEEVETEVVEVQEPIGLFLEIAGLESDDLTVPAEVESIWLEGSTLPDAIVSVDGELVLPDEYGIFGVEVPLEIGANDVTVIASDADGNVVEKTIYVVRED
ncbi:MAG: hypothetical protein HY332_17380 [Chloroflexi bacterium]|nr:hypothetical protein [Chloroflexota bacterium]